MLSGSLVNLGHNYRRPGTGSVDALGGVFGKAASETGKRTGGGRRKDQGLGWIGGFLHHGRQCRESGRSDEAVGSLSEDYFDATPDVGEFEYDLRGSERPRPGTDRDEDQSLL